MQSLFGALLTVGYVGAFTKQIAASPESSQINDQVSAALTKSYSSAEAVASRYPQYANEIVEAARQSFVHGQRWAFTAGLVGMALGTVLVWFAFPDKEREIEMIAAYEAADAN